VKEASVARDILVVLKLAAAASSQGN